MTRIIPRSSWAARAPSNRTTIARSRRRAFVVHYEGVSATTRTGSLAVQGIQRFHMDGNGWADIGYNFVITQAGEIFEGRGWDTLGAHAGSEGNIEGIGVQVHIGGSQQPTPAALTALLWLKGEADRMMGRELAWRKHSDYMRTSCPGQPLTDWLARGRPLPTAVWDGSPVPGCTVSTPYGARGKYWSTDRNAAGLGLHTGEDYAAREGTPVVAVVGGTVTIRDDPAFGCMSILKGDNGRTYWYCHLKRGSRDPWRGERVRAGQKIAEVGNTGNATGAHLHIEDCTSATTWKQGLRKPSWPQPSAAKPVTLTPVSVQEDPMPEFRESTFTFVHPGHSDFATDMNRALVDGSVIGPLHYTATAVIHGPAGAKVRGRFAFLDRSRPAWVGRSPELLGVGNRLLLSKVGRTADPECSIYVDVWSDTPGEVFVEQAIEYRKL